MSFSISVLTSTGLPFYFRNIAEDPADTEINMRFYNFVHSLNQGGDIPSRQQQFDLQAGLVSALYEFTRLLESPIDLLKLKPLPRTDSNGIIVSQNPLLPVEIPPESDVLVTARTETFLNPRNYEAKINLIYKYIITNHLPLGPDTRIRDAEDELVYNLLIDKAARDRIKSRESEISELCQRLITDYASYGLQSICIASFDANPLFIANSSDSIVREILRNMGVVPNVKEYQWEFRASRFEKESKWVFIINSGCGVKLEEVFMPFFYILICGDGSFLGDSPTTIYQSLNAILDE
jgi:hypothetical protein